MRRPNGAARLRNRARDAAERDEAERLAHQPRNLRQRRPALGPAAAAHHPVLLDQPAEAGEQQHHGMVGDLLDEGVGDVGDGNAARRRGLDVDAVDADGAERDDFAGLQSVDDRLGDRDALGVDGVGGPRGGDEPGLVGRSLDDLGVDRIERLALVGIIAARDGEARALRRHHPVFRHVLLPIWFLVGARPSRGPSRLLREIGQVAYNSQLSLR
ncbi:hypothetical protein ACVWW2_007494 [Bradyrhizobium sp. LM4.3]